MVNSSYSRDAARSSFEVIGRLLLVLSRSRSEVREYNMLDVSAIINSEQIFDEVAPDIVVRTSTRFILQLFSGTVLDA